MTLYIKFISIITFTILLVSCGSGGGGVSSSIETSRVTIVIGSNTQSSNISVEKNSFFAEVKEFLEIFMPAEAVAAIPPSVHRIMFKIEGQGMPTITRDVLVAGRIEIIETFEVPNGLRLFKAFAYNDKNDLLYSGFNSQDINGDTDLQIVVSKLQVFVSNSGSDNVSVIDPSTFEVQTLDCSLLGEVSCIEPRNLATSHNSLMVYVPFQNSDNTININPNVPEFDSVISSGFNEPYAVAFTCDDSEAWVVNRGSGSSTGSVTVINTATQSVITTISDECFSSPEGIAIANGKAYVANSGNGTVCVVDVATKSVLTSINVGGEPRFAVATPDEQFVYVSTDSSDAGVKKILTSLDLVIGKISVRGINLAVAEIIMPDGLKKVKVYVGTQSNSMEVIDLSDDSVNTVDFTGALSIYGVAILSDGSRGFATDESKGVVYVFDPSDNDKVFTEGGSPIEIPVGIAPRALTSVPSPFTTCP